MVFSVQQRGIENLLKHKKPPKREVRKTPRTANKSGRATAPQKDEKNYPSFVRRQRPVRRHFTRQWLLLY